MITPDEAETGAETTGRHAEEAERLLEVVEHEFPDNPKAMDHFYALYRRTYCEGQPVRGSEPLIGTTCVQVPEEIVLALGARPLRVCGGSSALAQRGAEQLPARTCSLIASALGMLAEKGAPLGGRELALLVSPTTCQSKSKAMQRAEEMGYAVHVLGVPQSNELEADREYFYASVWRLTARLEKTLGRRLDAGKLEAAIRKVNSARAQFRRMQALRAGPKPVLLGKDALLVSLAYLFDDLDEWTAAVSRLNDELEGRRPAALEQRWGRAPRVLLAGSPPIFPNLKVPLLVERLGGLIVADEVCTSDRLLHDAVAFAEPHLDDMVPAVADRALRPNTCPFYAKNTERIRRLLELVRTSKADGIIYQVFSGCQIFDLEQRAVERALSQAGVPMLAVETDYSPDDLGQLTTRVETFLDIAGSRS
jgi:benzoyl-CoA reductase/2-hydroxyglutaryl-CoA dehydratase subunit BcrC/BadD/HgdB